MAEAMAKGLRRNSHETAENTHPNGDDDKVTMLAGRAKKTQFVLGEETSKTVDKLRRLTKASNRSEVIRRAIGLYEVFVEEKADGVFNKEGRIRVVM